MLQTSRVNSRSSQTLYMPNTKNIVKLLLKKYPAPKTALNFSNTLELLIATILSARCTDIKVNEVTKKLFIKYKTLDAYIKADLKTFESDIRPTGFYRNKAKMVTDCCWKLAEDFDGKVPGSMEELTTLPGVGRKTANVVLGSGFGKQTIAVDTHVLRVSNRLGLADSDNPDRVEDALVSVLPGNKLTALNLAIILHGRETCNSRKPKCGKCILYKECEWTDKINYEL